MVNSWDNADGLHLTFGTDKTTATTAGEYKTFGELRTTEVKIDLSTLAVTTPLILANTTYFPKCRIEEVIIEVQTAATSSGSGTVDIGFIKQDRTTELDYNGLIAAEVKGALDTAGKKVTYINGTSKAGALIGTTTTDVGLLVANVNTAVYQTGIVYVRIKWRPN